MVLYNKDLITKSKEVQAVLRNVRYRSGLTMKVLAEKLGGPWELTEESTRAWIEKVEIEPEHLIRGLIVYNSKARGYDLKKVEKRITDYLRTTNANKGELEHILILLRKIQPDFNYVKAE